MAEPNIALPELRDGLEEVSPNRWKAFVIAHRQIGQSGCFLASLISAVFAPSGFDGLQGTGPYPLLALLLDAVEDHATGCKAYVSSYDQRRFTLLTETFRFWQTLARMALLTPSDEAYRSVSRWHLAGFRHPMVLPAVSGRWREWVTKRIIVLPLAQLEAGQETFLPTVDG